MVLGGYGACGVLAAVASIVDDLRLTFGLAFRWVWVLLGAEFAGLIFALIAGEIGLNMPVVNVAVWAWYAGVLFCQFQVGRTVARRAEGRELSACCALIIAQWAPENLFTYAPLLALGKPVSFRGLIPQWECLLSIVGALVVRFSKCNYNRRSYNC